jgi:hypothetical protein
MKTLSSLLLGIIATVSFIFFAVSSGSESEKSKEPEKKIIRVSDIQDCQTVLVEKWVGKNVTDFVKVYGEASSAYGSDYIWNDLVVIKEPAGTFTYDIWMSYYDNTIEGFKFGSKSKQ